MPAAQMMGMPVLSIGKRDLGRRLPGLYFAALFVEANSRVLSSPCFCDKEIVCANL